MKNHYQAPLIDVQECTKIDILWASTSGFDDNEYFNYDWVDKWF